MSQKNRLRKKYLNLRKNRYFNIDKNFFLRRQLLFPTNMVKYYCVVDFSQSYGPKSLLPLTIVITSDIPGDNYDNKSWF